LLHATYVHPYVRRNKTDSADADALVRAVQDKDLIPVPVKSENHQALQSLHRIRERWKSARVASLNTARALLAEFGHVSPKNVGEAQLREGVERVPELMRADIEAVIEQCDELKKKIRSMDKKLAAYCKVDPQCGRLTSVQSIGVTTATALVARVPNITLSNRVGVSPTT
jgi:transposase